MPPPTVTVIPDPEERRQIRRKYSRTALILLLNMAIFNILGELAAVLVYAMFGDAAADPSHETVITLLSILPPILSETVSIILGAKLLGINFKRLTANRENYSGATVAKLITLCIGLQFAASIIAAVIQALLELVGLKGATPDLSATTSFTANILMSFYACILGPVLEELLYRGVLLQSMRKYNERFAIILSALIFGLMHQNYQQFILGFMLGIPLAIVTIKYDSLIPSIFTHIFVNTTGMLSTYLMQYFAPEFYDAALNGGEADISSIGGAGMAVILLTVLFRIAFLIAGIVVGIVSIVKGGNMKRPTPAGRSRGLPVLVRSVPWLIALVLYCYLAFIAPFLN